ncbi:unnamed protein product [Albugo candida]|uniref:Uncharacterized protein n=1 Tax=Albugo candida TaxID=65357 RepID=A0A024GFV0_9STRA|nr:unnamed protein product [Albugo candida]|eukprot:CCI45638.1 unnamed protein product [Albugo candida]
MRFVFWSVLSILHWTLPDSVTSEDILAQETIEKPINVRGANQQTVENDAKAINSMNKLVYDAEVKLLCEHIGDCHSCPASEKDEVHCVKTGYRQELSCMKKDFDTITEPGKLTIKTREIKFKACTPRDTTSSTLIRVLLFEMLMVVTLVGAVGALNKEKRKHLSRFDLRQDSRQRKPFLDSASNKNDD